MLKFVLDVNTPRIDFLKYLSKTNTNFKNKMENQFLFYSYNSDVCIEYKYLAMTVCVDG